MPVLTRYLSPDAYGVAALVGTVVSLVSVIALAGIDMGYARHVFSGQWGDAVSIEAFCWRWVIAAAVGACGVAGLVWWFGVPGFGLSPKHAGYVVAGIFFSTLLAMAQTRARLDNRYKQLAWIQLAVGCVAAASSIAIATLWRQDATALLVAMVLGYGLPVLLLGAPPLRRLAAPSGLSPSQRKNVVTAGLAGVVTAPAYWVLSSSDRWFLAAYHDHAVVGIYSIAFTVGTVGMVVSTAITAAWLPELSRDEAAASGPAMSAHKRDMVQWLLGALLIVAVAVTASGGDVIRALADRRFHAAANSVPWLAAGVMCYGVMHVGNALLIMKSRLHWAAGAWLLALVVSVGLNLWLVPARGAQGAAMVQAISFLFVMVMVWIAVLRFEPVALQWGRLAAACSIGFASAMLMHSAWFDHPWISLAAKLPVGLLFAGTCLWLIAPMTLNSVLEFLRRTA
jgi:O-antigen/teichoic acid export membrane protein